MVFQVVAEREFDWPVEMRVPQDGGRHVTARFHLRLRQIQKKRMRAVLEELRGLDADPGLDEAGREARAVALLQEIVVGWGADVTDGDKQPLPFSAANLAILIDQVGVLEAIVAAYVAAVSGAGREERRRGN